MAAADVLVPEAVIFVTGRALENPTLRPTGCVKNESQPELWYTYICLLAESLTFSALVYTRTKTRI